MLKVCTDFRRQAAWGQKYHVSRIQSSRETIPWPQTNHYSLLLEQKRVLGTVSVERLAHCPTIHLKQKIISAWRIQKFLLVPGL